MVVTSDGMLLEHWHNVLSPVERTSPHQMFEALCSIASSLGFDYCAFGIRFPFPTTRPSVHMYNNYPETWRQRYASEDYLAIDPSVAHAARSSKPALWSDEMFVEAPKLMSEARDVGLRYGWLKSTVETGGIAGMLTLVRSSEAIGALELKEIELKLSWLANMVHFAFAKALIVQPGPTLGACLTGREVEIMRWTADGKTADEISDILTISHNTVNFHIKNVMAKLQTNNKTSATVRAAMMGILA